MSPRPWLNYHHLMYFKTIAIEGGIAKAAKKLRLGQPTLSTQMKQFEDTIGQILFDRSKRQLQLTEAGSLVLGYAKEIFKLGDELIDSLHDQQDLSKAQVQIGAMDTVPKHLILKVFHAAQMQKNCVVTISEGHGDELLRELKAHRTDLVISNYTPPVGEATNFYAKCISKMPVVICGAQKFSSLAKGFPESLNGQPFIMPTTQSKLRHEIEHYFKLNEIQVNLVAEVQDTSLQKLMGMYGDGLIPLAFPAAQELLKQKDLINIGILPNVHEELWLIAAQRRIQNPIAASLMKSFKL